MTFSVLGHDINTSSKTRPPQLPPRAPREKAGGPRIRSLDDPKPWPDWLPEAQRLFV